MDAVIGVLSVIGFIVSLALIVVFAIKKKENSSAINFACVLFYDICGLRRIAG